MISVAKWRQFIRVDINQKEIEHFDRDVRKSMTKLAKIQDRTLGEELGRLIVAKAKQYSPDEWKPGTGKLKRGIMWELPRARRGKMELRVLSTAKRGGVPYATIQEKGLIKWRRATKGPFMKFPDKEGGRMLRVKSARPIPASRYMERAIRDVLRANEAKIGDAFTAWIEAREALRAARVSKGSNKVTPKKISGISDSEIDAAESTPEPATSWDEDRGGDPYDEDYD